MDAQTSTGSARRTVEGEVEAKQATDKPRGMGLVLLFGTLAAAIGMFIVYSLIF